MSTAPIEIGFRRAETGIGAGRLHLVCGCMFSGKTGQLLDHAMGWPRDRVRLFKHVIDDRYAWSHVVSHNGRTHPATAVEESEAIEAAVTDGVEFVGVDEGHFFDTSLVNACVGLASAGVEVLVTALNMDSWGRPFPQIEELRRVADMVTVKRAECARCGEPANRTQRLTAIVDGRMVGGAGDYEPRCASCWTPPPESCDQMTRPASNTGPSVQQSS